MAFLPELILAAGALAIFGVTLSEQHVRLARRLAMLTALAMSAASALTLGCEAVLFDGAYQVDAFSQGLKLVVGVGYLLVALVSGELPDIRPDVKPEYFLFLTLTITGLTLLVSSIDLITLVVALELSSFPLYVLVAMRRERADQRAQMESAIKYIVFGITATGIMLFGLSYLFGLTGTTSLPVMMARLRPVLDSPLAITGLALTFAGLFYKLAVFPFHFWTPDVYQGASNETASLVASLPKVGAAAVLARLVALAAPEHRPIVLLLTCLAVASMFYGNLVALWQTDLKRLLGFSGIAHAGYALIGFVALDTAGFTAALYYLISYLFMVLACFVVVCRVASDGTNVAIGDLAGLHRRSPWLAVTLLVGVFALAGMPPFAGFMGKLTLLKAALAQGHLALVLLAVINSAIAIYYYLVIVREAFFRDPGAVSAIAINTPTRLLCAGLTAAIVLLGIGAGLVLEVIATWCELLTGPPAP